MRFIILMALLAIGTEAAAQRRCYLALQARGLVQVMDMAASLASCQRGPALAL